jgi:hypothetical protein
VSLASDPIDELGVSWVRPRPQGTYVPTVGPVPLPVPVQAKPPQLRSVTASDLLAEPEPAFDSLVDGLVPACGVVLLAGDPKSFKTLEALQLAVTVGHADVGRFLDRDVQHGPVIFVEEEGSRHKLRERVQMMSTGLGLSTPPEIHFALHEGLRLDERPSVALLTALVAEVKPRLVVLDPLVMLHSGDENKASEMGRVMRALIALAAEHDCCVLVVHHVNKPQAERKTTRAAQRLRGSSAFAGATDANLIMDRDGDYTARLRGEYRDAEPVELYLELDPTTLLLSVGEAPDASGKVRRPDLVAFVSERGEVTAAAVAEHFEASRNTAKRALTEAVNAGLLDTARTANRTDVFFPVTA